MPVDKDPLMAPNLRRSVRPNEVEPGLRDPNFLHCPYMPVKPSRKSSRNCLSSPPIAELREEGDSGRKTGGLHVGKNAKSRDGI